MVWERRNGRNISRGQKNVLEGNIPEDLSQEVELSRKFVMQNETPHLNLFPEMNGLPRMCPNTKNAKLKHTPRKNWNGNDPVT